MHKSSFRQKFLLVLFGLTLTLVLLEGGLRLAGVVVFFLQQQHNHVSFSKGEYRILCLGESTTALGGEDSYPSQLEAKLNGRDLAVKYTVINEGIISTNTNYILAHLEQNLDKYKPQMVVVMMGINDKVYLHDFTKKLWWEGLKAFIKDLRVYKLARLIHDRFKQRSIQPLAGEVSSVVTQEDTSQKEEVFLKSLIMAGYQSYKDHMARSAAYSHNGHRDDAKGEENLANQAAVSTNAVCIELARRYRLKGMYQEAEDLLERTAGFDTDHLDLFQQWGELYLAEGQSLKAVKILQAALALDPKNSDVLLDLAHAYHQAHQEMAFLVYAAYLQSKSQDYWGYIELAQWLKDAGHDEVAKTYLDRAIEVSPDFEQAYLDTGKVLESEGQYQKAEELYLKEVPRFSQNSLLYQALGQLYEKQGDQKHADLYLQKALAGEMSEYCPATLINFKLLLDKILGRHIKVVIMQYPLREIGILKGYLGERSGLIYVENDLNFKQALAAGGYWHYFKDNFAANFGHCTRAGNELIADNLAEAVLKDE